MNAMHTMYCWHCLCSTFSRGTHSFDILHDLHWLPIDQRIEFKLATLTYNILNFSQPAYLRSLLNYHTPTRSLRLPTPIFCRFHVSAQLLPPAVLALQPPQSETHYPLASVVLPLQILSVASLKLTSSSRPTAPPSGSAKCLRFGHWLTLCTLNMHILTYLLILAFKVIQGHWNWRQSRTSVRLPISD